MKNKGIISLLAILVIVLGVFAYLLSSQKLTSDFSFKKEIESTESLSDSDDLDSLEEDILNTDLTNVDKELGIIQDEIEASAND